MPRSKFFEGDILTYPADVYNIKELEQLVFELREMIQSTSINHFDFSQNIELHSNNKTRLNSKSPGLENKNEVNQHYQRKIRLRHKLIRIQKEFHFSKTYMKNFQSLTPRELEIINHLVRGLNNLEIANKLFISRYTVEQHRKHINYKLKINSFARLMNYAYSYDLL